MSTALNLEHFDTTIRPQDDLFRHANGHWLSSVVIDADKTGAGAITDLHDQAERDVLAIITGLSAAEGESEAGKVAALYASFMAEEQIEELGAAPLKPLLERIDAISDTVDFSRHLGWSLRHGFSSLVSFGEEADPGNPKRYIMFAGQAGIGLPDEEYYREAEHEQTREQYRAHLEKMFTLAGFADAASQAEAVYGLETQIAAAHWDKVRTREIREMYNPMSWDEFTASAAGIDWVAFAEGAELPTSKVAELVVCQPSFATDAAKLVAGQELAAWKSWARWKAISGLASYLSEDFVAARFEFYGKQLHGIEQLRERWKRGVGLTEGALGEAIGKIYVERHFPPAAKAAMDELVANLLLAYRNSIEKLSWMGEDTRAEALTKLSKFTPKIAYPDRWRDYSGLQIGSDLVANVLAISAFEFEYTLSRLGGPIDLDEWMMYPQTVNAYYHPLRNEIVFPAAILQPPFFNVEADDAVNYGSIGAVIGHEIGHGFDDQGSTCDGDGALRDWWQPSDREAFEARTKSLIGQFDPLSPEGADGQCVNGELTIGENIGDLGGLGIAWDAWLLAGGDPNGEPIDGYTPGQRFFLGWAASWRSKSRPESVKQRLATDPHSPAEFRCNQIVRNLDAFYQAFDVTAKDAAWLPKEERVAIW